MRIKSFIAPTIQQALLDIKREMGDSSLILETRKIEEGDVRGISGRKLIEIIAAEKFIRQDPDRKLNCNNRISAFKNIDHEGAMPLSDRHNYGLENDLPVASRELFRELRAQQVEKEHAQVLIGETLREFDKVPTASPAASLRKQGCGAVGKDGVERKDLQRHVIKERIASKIKIPDSNSAGMKTHRIMAFMGTTGVGKTTTLSKLASDARKHTDKGIILISVKDDSVGKLNKTADLIGATVWDVTTHQELRTIIEEFGSTSLIFIDTPGINHLDNVELLKLKAYIHNIPNLETHLVVNATSRYTDVINIVKNFNTIPVHRLLFTKVDETNIYGTLFSVAMKTQIPLSYITDGRKIPEDIKPVTKHMIAKMVLGQ